jgi:hypothetical protein
MPPQAEYIRGVTEYSGSVRIVNLPQPFFAKPSMLGISGLPFCEEQRDLS